MTDTVLDRLVVRLEAALEYNPNVFAAPAALLWPDETGQWRPVVQRLGDDLPIVTLGPYDPDQRQGPSYWLRCVLARTIDIGLPDGIPIVYLPGVARGALRAVESCPPELAPIAELQYRGNEFTQPKSAREWSIRSLLTNAERGLGLNIADGPETARALSLALEQLLDQRMDRLSKQVLDADFFNDLVNPDPVSMLLGWLDDPASYPQRVDRNQWAAFVQKCVGEFGFHPEKDGVVIAARKLGERDGGWSQVWKRFTETPQRYPGVVERLRQAKPMELSFEFTDAWPQDSEVAEEQLRNALREFESLTAEDARKAAKVLDGEHAWRRGTVWADLGLAPLSFAVEQLALLAERTASAPVTVLDALRQRYLEADWRADDAALRALAAVSTRADRDAVATAVTAMYRPWLDASAAALQGAIGPMANAGTYEPSPAVSRTPGTVTVFVDGLRLDVAQRIVDRLTAGSFDIELTTSLAALPTVTQTAKPALVPVGNGALTAGSDLHAANAATGTKATLQVLRSLMEDAEVQVLGSTDTGDPAGTAWTEAGDIDSRGHELGVRLVDYLDEEVGRIVGRIRELFDAGWRRVQVVTDHGWLLLPAPMEKVDVPVATTEIKKGRCARLKDGAVVDVPTVPWFWDQDVRIALAPGISCFEAGKHYEHGGVSPQECFVPRLSVTAVASGTPTSGPEITKITWLGLLCRIEVKGVSPGVIVDLRALAGDPKTSIVEIAKETAGGKRVSLLVPDEELEGERGYLVFVAPNGDILLQRDVIVGKNR